MIKTVAAIALLVILTNCAFSQASKLLEFDFKKGATSTSPTTLDPSLSSPGLVRSVSATTIVASKAYQSDGWTTQKAVDPNNYVEVSITPNSGYNLILTSVDISLSRATSASSGGRYGATVATIAHNGTGDFNTSSTSILNTTAKQSTWVFPSAVTVLSGNSLSIRLYGYKAQSTAGLVRIQSIAVFGSSVIYQTIAAGANSWSVNNWSAGATSGCPTTGYNKLFTLANVNICNAGTGSGNLSANGMTFSSIISTQNYTMTASSGSLSTGGGVMSVNVGTGTTLDFAPVNFATATGTGVYKTGAGTFISGNTNPYNGGFTMDNGTMLISTANALGSGTVTIPVLSSGSSCTLASSNAASLAITNPLNISDKLTLGLGTPLTTANTTYNGAGSINFNGNVALANNPTVTLGGGYNK